MTTIDPYSRIVDFFDKDETAGSFLSEDGEGGFTGAVYRMAREIDRFRALSTATPADVADLIADLTAEDFRHEMQHLRSSVEIDRLLQQSAATLLSLSAERDALKHDAGELVVAQYATSAAQTRIADLEELIAAQHGDVVVRTANLLYEKDDKIASLSARCGEMERALERMIVLYESEYDPDFMPPRPTWLQAALSRRATGDE